MPSNADIRPTRLEYLRTKKRIKIAKKGLKLLKLKRQALILEFFSISKASSRLRGELNAELIKGYQSIRMAEMIDGEMRLENEAMKIPQLKKLLITPKNVMGVKIPRLEGGRREALLTDYLFDALSTLLISSDIRNAGGFYDHAEKLSKHYFADFNVQFVPLEQSILRSLHISLTCSSEDPVLPKCPGHFDDVFTSGEINPIEVLQVENINRSKIFADKFLPLNSIIHVLVYSDENLQVKSVNSGIIEKLEHLGDLQDNGWFFTSASGKKIDGRYIFATEPSVSKNDLIFSIGDNTADNIEIKNTEEGGGCLIATAAFGSELSSQVQFLREIRDSTVLQTESGTSFMAGFNQFYYSFSPAIADYERENPTFKEAVKITLTPLLTSLTLLQYADIDSESEMLGYGIGIILLNIGMYFVAPAF